MSERAKIGAGAKVLVAAVAAAAFAVNFAPSDWVRIHVLAALGDPPYAGPWALFAHAFLYSTLTALVSLVAWMVLAALKLLPGIPLGKGRHTLLWGLGGGALTIGMVIVFFFYTAPDAIHYVPPKPWIIAGNFFSNFYEEFIFRGFLLAALTVVIGFWPAAIVTSLAFGLVHTQFPLPVQFLVAAGGLVWCGVFRLARTLWAPYLSHMTLDVVGDSLIG